MWRDRCGPGGRTAVIAAATLGRRVAALDAIDKLRQIDRPAD
ncbi:hypothetical protein [Streptomyces sp. NPDC001508]